MKKTVGDKLKVKASGGIAPTMTPCHCSTRAQTALEQVPA